MLRKDQVPGPPVRRHQPGAGGQARTRTPPAAILAVVRWLVTSDEAAALSGTTIEAQDFCLERKLYPSWK